MAHLSLADRPVPEMLITPVWTFGPKKHKFYISSPSCLDFWPTEPKIKWHDSRSIADLF